MGVKSNAIGGGKEYSEFTAPIRWVKTMVTALSNANKNIRGLTQITTIVPA